MNAPAYESPLLGRTSVAWAEGVLGDARTLLEDHAHLERKAAANALALLPRWPREWDDAPAESPERAFAESWARALTGIARDEIEHLRLVMRILRGRGGRLGRVHRNPYAASLRGQVRQGHGRHELADRLLVSALIEARSSERFTRLGEVAEDEELRRLYRGLEASERGHTRVFLDLARRLPGAGDATARLAELSQAEARVLAEQPPGGGMHSGEPREGT